MCLNLKTKVFYFVLVIIISPMVLVAQRDLPEKAMGMPKIFNNEEESWRWEDVAKRRAWGELSTTKYWTVYIDREGVKSYKDSIGNDVKERSLGFMDAYKVADVKNGRALLYKDKGMLKDLLISSQAKSVGWVSVDELLLWSTCPRTRNQVYKKAVIIKNVEQLNPVKGADEASPEFFKSPKEEVGNGYRATELDFYFVFKSVGLSVLLYDGNEIRPDNEGSYKSITHGWMHKGMYVDWNDRICYEPNFGSEFIGKVAAVYKNKNTALLYKLGKNPENDKIWESKLEEKRWEPSYPRFPVLDTSLDNGTVAVATIATLGENGKSVDWDMINKTKKQIEEIRKRLETVNVVFVMDGTSSMRNYYLPMANAVGESMRMLSENKTANMRFGAVVYRNYADADDGRLCESIKLTTNYKEVANWLSGKARDCRSVGRGHYEAMFYGLDYALTKMDWGKNQANFIILVGDAGNEDNDAKGFSVETIAQKMANFNVNFVAYQAKNEENKDASGGSAYITFIKQIKKIMQRELTVVLNKEITLEHIENKYTYKYDNLPIMYASLTYYDVNENGNDKELQNLVRDVIIDFKKISDEKAIAFEKAIQNLGTQQKTGGKLIDEQYAIGLMRANGCSDEQIENLRNQNVVFKLRGYTSINVEETDVFTTSVFMPEDELYDLIKNIKKVTRVENVTNKRQELQDALKTLALIYIAQKDCENLNIGDIMAAMLSLQTKTKKDPLLGINIKDITLPSRVDENKIDAFIETLRDDVIELESVKKDRSYYYERNGTKYYYILMEKMPLQH